MNDRWCYNAPTCLPWLEFLPAYDIVLSKLKRYNTIFPQEAAVRLHNGSHDKGSR